jgi:hypothetical protein
VGGRLLQPLFVKTQHLSHTASFVFAYAGGVTSLSDM